MKTVLENIIILHMSTINDDHMIYVSWDMERDGQNFLSFLTIFWPFIPPPGSQKKNKNFEKMKKAWRYYYFTHVYHKWESHGVWCLRYGARQTEFINILDHFLPFYHWNNPDNQNFEKMKNILEILSFYTFSPSMNMTYSMVPVMSDIILCHFWELITYLPH